MLKGLQVDMVAKEELLAKERAKQVNAENKMRDIIGKDINYNSPQQMAALLYVELRLIAAFPTLCFRVDGESVRRGFGKVNAKELKAWLHAALPRTLASRRNSAYREYRSKSHDHILSAA